MNCTRCKGTGFLNLEQVDDDTLRRFEETGDVQVILDWIETGESDVGPCDCCGNGDAYGWYFVPGLHDLSDKSAPFPNCH